MADKDKFPFDTKKKEHFDPKKRQDEVERKKAAAKKKLNEKDDDLSNAILKGMADKVNSAETKEEIKKAEDRYNTYKKLLDTKGKK